MKGREIFITLLKIGPSAGESKTYDVSVDWYQVMENGWVAITPIKSADGSCTYMLLPPWRVVRIYSIEPLD